MVRAKQNNPRSLANCMDWTKRRTRQRSSVAFTTWGQMRLVTRMLNVRRPKAMTNPDPTQIDLESQTFSSSGVILVVTCVVVRTSKCRTVGECRLEAFRLKDQTRPLT